MDGDSRGRAGAYEAFARGRRWALLAVVALALGVSTAAAQATAAPMIRRIIGVSIQGSTVLVTIGAGSNDGVRSGWKVCLVRGESDEPLPGGEVEVIRVDRAVTVGKVHLPPEQLRTKLHALLRP